MGLTPQEQELGALAVARGLITQGQLDRCVREKEQSAASIPLRELLARREFITPDDLASLERSLLAPASASTPPAAPPAGDSVSTSDPSAKAFAKAEASSRNYTQSRRPKTVGVTPPPTVRAPATEPNFGISELARSLGMFADPSKTPTPAGPVAPHVPLSSQSRQSPPLPAFPGEAPGGVPTRHPAISQSPLPDLSASIPATEDLAPYVSGLPDAKSGYQYLFPVLDPEEENEAIELADRLASLPAEASAKEGVGMSEEEAPAAPPPAPARALQSALSEDRSEAEVRLQGPNAPASEDLEGYFPEEASEIQKSLDQERMRQQDPAAPPAPATAPGGKEANPAVGAAKSEDQTPAKGSSTGKAPSDDPWALKVPTVSQNERMLTVSRPSEKVDVDSLLDEEGDLAKSKSAGPACPEPSRGAPGESGAAVPGKGAPGPSLQERLTSMKRSSPAPVSGPSRSLEPRPSVGAVPPSEEKELEKPAPSKPAAAPAARAPASPRPAAAPAAKPPAPPRPVAVPTAKAPVPPKPGAASFPTAAAKPVAKQYVPSDSLKELDLDAPVDKAPASRAATPRPPSSPPRPLDSARGRRAAPKPMQIENDEGEDLPPVSASTSASRVASEDQEVAAPALRRTAPLPTYAFGAEDASEESRRKKLLVLFGVLNLLTIIGLLWLLLE